MREWGQLTLYLEPAKMLVQRTFFYPLYFTSWRDISLAFYFVDDIYVWEIVRKILKILLFFFFTFFYS